jgi:DmsE family decaheme c-type cytochrome
VVACVALAPGAGTAAAQEVHWPSLNRNYEGATFVNDPEVCRACHEGAMQAFGGTPHARAAGRCETCHGPRSKHIEDPGRQLAWADLSAAQQSTVCMQCHEGGARMTWRGGTHVSSDVSCSSCHTVMAARSERALLGRERVEATCYACHGEIRAQMSKSSHHPVREGRVDCASCHNAHGSTPGLLRTATLNETCVSCHSEKRGPFVWEHAPVRESCATCHEPHGSSNRGLLTRKDPFVCLQCHSYGGHVNLPRYNRVSNPYGGGCTNCHVSTHGSNHPSGAKLTR